MMCCEQMFSQLRQNPLHFVHGYDPRVRVSLAGVLCCPTCCDMVRRVLDVEWGCTCAHSDMAAKIWLDGGGRWGVESKEMKRRERGSTRCST